MDSFGLKGVGPRQRAVYRGVMALILQQGALDFHKRGRITARLLADKGNPVDDHHIFARAFLDDKGYPPALRDCIVNRTYIDRETNRRLSRRPPSDYFREIRAKHGSAATDQLLVSHFMPQGSGSPLLTDDFTKFLEQREAALLAAVAERTRGQGLTTKPSGPDDQSPGTSDADEGELEENGTIDRPYWERKTSPESLAVVDACLQIIRDFVPDAELRYKRLSIGLRSGRRKLNFVLFRPRPHLVRAEARLRDKAKWSEELRGGDLRVIQSSGKRLKVELHGDGIEARLALLRTLFEASYREEEGHSAT